ncbi:farnesyl diphosphate synthase [Streptococcus pneumoniae]|nr:farnesyl diphosphate synthase [Streptococcus pneumoniae]
MSLEELQIIHANKTGKLLAYPFQAAAIIAELSPEMQVKLKTVGELIGLAFQVRDDVLDVTASFEEIGKTPQKDLQAEKSTYPALLGLEESIAFCNQTLDQANEKLEEIAQQLPFETESIVSVVESLRING